MPDPRATPDAFVPDFEGALAYDAPYLVEKLLKDSIARTEDEARALFREVKRYFVLTSVESSKTFEMSSLLIDQAWHEFVLFTSSYTSYCRRFFGHYLPHAPANAPELEELDGPPAGSFDDFASAYERTFGEPPPALWRDAANVRVDRRVHVNERRSLRVVDDGAGWVSLVSADGASLVETSGLAKEALSFVASTPVFYVRELPGGLADEEKIGLVEQLVEADVVRLAA